MIFTYNLTPRSAEVGGGWRLHLIENATDVGGGIFLPHSSTTGSPPPPREGDDDDFDKAFANADAEAKLWLREHKLLTKQQCAKAYEIKATRTGWKGRLYKDGHVHAVLSGGPDSYEVLLHEISEFCDT